MAETGAGNVKRSVTIAGHRTSISLEEEFWAALKEAACSEKVSVTELVRRIDAGRGARNLSSAIRVYVLGYARGRSGGACAAQD